MLRLTSAAEDLARLYSWLDAAAAEQGLPATILYGMHVALEEAVANVAKHAFPPGEYGDIAVTLRREPDAALLEVEDRGRAFDATAAALPARPASLLDAEPGGAGLGLIRHYCHDLRYERLDGRNRLTLCFRTPAA
jgi:anti-sigma regulatory factor (Ser/Thr protein kinase)